MTGRELFFYMLEGKETDQVPCSLTMYNNFILATGQADQPWRGGMDPFGVNWIATKEGCIPEPGRFLFEDIADWKEYVHFPDLDSLGLEKVAPLELSKADRDNKVQVLFSVCGLFERMAAFMGFENTLIALIEDPKSCHEFLDAFADYKIAVFERAYELYHPDMYIMFDDIATARGLFMSIETWREIFKPHLKKIVDAVREKGVIYGQHTCGKCEDAIADYVELGIRYWHSAQSMNDLEKILRTYGKDMIVDGGWDSSGPASYIGATVEQAIAETRRMRAAYGSYNNFIMTPVLLNEKGNSLLVGDERLPVIIEEWAKISKR